MLSSWRMPSRHVLSRQWRFIKPLVKGAPRFSPFVQRSTGVLQKQTARSYFQVSLLRFLSLELQRVAVSKKLASPKPKSKQQNPLGPQIKSWLKENRELLQHCDAAYRIDHSDARSWQLFKEQFSRARTGERVSLKFSGHEVILGGKHFDRIFQYGQVRGKGAGRRGSLCKKARPASLKDGNFILKAPGTVFDGREKHVLLIHVSPKGTVFELFELDAFRGNKYDDSLLRFGSRQFIASIQKKDPLTVAKRKMRS